jgi:RNA polymerase sigma-70 factor (ECF subfamily)
LITACKGNTLSKYHLEAAIAYWHTTTADKNKWQHILKLYNELILIEYSPMTALNRTFAFAKVYGHEQAIQEVEKLNLNSKNYYHSMLGYLYADTNIDEAINHYNKAIALTKSETEKQTLRKEIKRLNNKNSS